MSAEKPLTASDSCAPPAPASAPPTSIAASRARRGDKPAATNASGRSPAARNRMPQRVRFTAIVTTTVAIAATFDTSAGFVSTASPNPGHGGEFAPSP